MLRAMCEGPEIAVSVGVSEETLYRATRREKGSSWTDYATAAYARTRQQLRQQQINRAIGYKRKEKVPFNTAKGIEFHEVEKFYEPSDAMLKWLGIQYLNQKEKQDVRLEIPDYRIAGDDDPNGESEE